MSFEAEWREELDRWRLLLVLDPGWEIHYVADPTLRDCRAETLTEPANRIATVRFNPMLPPLERTPPHEMLHIVISSLEVAARQALPLLTNEARQLYENRLDAAVEETVERLLNAIHAVQQETPERIAKTDGCND